MRSSIFGADARTVRTMSPTCRIDRGWKTEDRGHRSSVSDLRPPTEQPKTTSFVEVDEIQLDGHEKRIFTGWMFAESPGLNAVEHPVFDVWLTDCQKPKGSIAQQSGGDPAAATPDAPPPADEDPFAPRRRVRR